MKTRINVCAFLLVACLTSAAFAAPQKVNFQGKLTDAAGNPISTTIGMAFSMYDVATGGTALWTETQTVTVTNGIYNVLLGKVNPIDTELTETKALWLGVKVGTDAEMTPRVELTPGLYDLIMLNAITLKNGKVGIGTTNPRAMLHIAQNDGAGDVVRAPIILSRYWADDNNTRGAAIFSYISTTHAHDQLVFAVSGTIGCCAESNSNPASYSQAKMVIQANGNVGIGTTEPQYKLEVAGTLRVSGADLAEPFDMTDIANLDLGDVVVIDSDNPEHVKKSQSAYDATVAGIVSSTTQAGYVAGSRSDGTSDKPVALVGRVLCNVSAENGAIKIGDLLTTSNTPGYAMKATDFEKRQGAILGKALQAFDGDTGQILVLVTLQ